MGWRLTLAVSALELAGIENSEACRIAAGMPSVKKHFPKTRTAVLEKVRSTVNNYRKTWGRRINIENELRIWLNHYKWMHRQELGEEYYQETRQGFIHRIAYALDCHGLNEWARAGPQIAWATTAHEWGKYGEAAQWYRNACDEINGMSLPEEWKHLYLPWLQRQIERCQQKEALDEALRPVLFEGRLVTLAEVIAGRRDVAQ